MKIPKKEATEIISVMQKSMKSLRYQSNFTEKAWTILQTLSSEDLFILCPPVKLTGGRKQGQYESKCLNCDGQTTFQKYSSGYAKYCSIACAGQHSWKQNKEKRLEGITKTQKTMQKLYGGHTTMTSNLKKKVLQTSGFFTDRKANAQKAKQTALSRYGAKGKSEEAIKRAKDSLKLTRLENPELYATSSYQRKEVCIKRRKFLIQGYEGEALKWLSKNGLNIKSVKINSVSVRYVDTNKIERVYISDFEGIYNGKRTVFEVKSDYTAGLLKSGQTMFYNLRRKAKAMKENNYRFLVVVMDSKFVGNIVKDFESKTLKEIRALVYQKGFAFD